MSTFQCTVVTPENPVLDEQVSFASIPAWDGQIGLLEMRAPLLVKLGQGSLRLDLANGQSLRYFIGGGFAQMKDDKLTILTDEAVAAQAIDREEAEVALKQALAVRATTPPELAKRDREVSRARAMVTLAGARG
jgi:F-type H+-transporting ATPase subunit epsilon